MLLHRSKTDTQVVTITPEAAEKMLEGNVHNRPLKQSIVENYADQMKRRQWRLNGEAIIIDNTGRLLDGQHRLYACWESKTEFETVLVTGVDPDTFATIDTGTKRSAADVLHIGGISKYVTTTAAAAVTCIEYRRGILRARGAPIKGRRSVTRTDVFEYVTKNKQLEVWVERARSSNGWTCAYASNIAAVLHLGAGKYREQAEEFMLGWLTGENLGSKSPILALRNRLATEKRMAKATRVALIIYAWNSYVDKKQLQFLRVPKGEELVIRGTEKS